MLCTFSSVRRYSTSCSYQSLPNYIIITLLYYFSSTETQVRVVFDYTAQESDELSIKVGEILEVLSEEVEDGWWNICNDCACLCMCMCMYTVHTGQLENDNLKNWRWQLLVCT